ncbi:nucleotide-binding universal stress UspA family protein [Chryseobacterium sp. H1D6B]|uniref:universal stress protein n=1 Tax=Chryseobacterium sp. H1D6B TaxID=2940588 RepID=UPI0015C705D9|nr:universal stress protein [Chryseobacterium sp. H1D6B]MDH6253335.1 nucleotide-binding universal stress UspA family protein [Chryseobacterium sp. H1D6B]
MRTILVPVDFTATTENAVRFAAEWAAQYDYRHIILLKTSKESEFDYLHIAEGHAFVNEENVNSLLERTQLLLNKLSSIITEKSAHLKVSTAVSDWTITKSINDLLKDQPSVELIILGSDDQASSSESFVSENIISIARTSPVRTLIVPNGYRYNIVKNILIPCDVNSITKLDRLFHHKSIIQHQDIHLMFLNIHTREKAAINNEKEKELQEYIHQYLTEIPSSIHYSYDENIINGILNFASSNETDLIIALPGRHSFLYYMASRSISEGIYQNMNQPVLILK